MVSRSLRAALPRSRRGCHLATIEDDGKLRGVLGIRKAADDLIAIVPAIAMTARRMRELPRERFDLAEAAANALRIDRHLMGPTPIDGCVGDLAFAPGHAVRSPLSSAEMFPSCSLVLGYQEERDAREVRMNGRGDEDDRMRSRFDGVGRVRPAQKVERMQKNLSLEKRDVARILALAKRDALSQAQLMKRALDAYEDLYGRVEV